jgi:hypothetical protein
MSGRNTIFNAAVLALLFVTLAETRALASNSYDMTWHTVDGGGGQSSGLGFDLHGTIGQPDAGLMSGGGFELASGFWAGIADPTTPTCPPDVAPPGGDGVVNVNDLLAVINGWGACPNPCPTCIPDITSDCLVNVNDLLAVINAWGECP